MRTKNLNLKKKLAFIASVAMIASTAAYLPADFAKDIGINTGIVAEAATAAAADTIDLFNVYVRVNGQYLNEAKDGFEKSSSDPSKLYRIEGVGDYLAADVSTGAGDGTHNTKFIYNAAKNEKITLPADTPANAIVELVVVPAAVASDVKLSDIYIDSNASSSLVTLGNDGKATVEKSADIVVVDGATATKGTDGNYNGGNVETVNFDGFKFEVAEYKNSPFAAESSVSYTVDSGTKTPVAKDNFGTAEVRKVSLSSGKDIYATAYTINDINNVKPGSTLKVEFSTFAAWTASASPSVSFGDDGKASTGVITFTSRTGLKEYYVFDFVKRASTVANGSTNLKIDGKSVDLTDGEAALSLLKEKDTKVVSETKVISGQFVTVYNVYSNADTTLDKTFTLSTASSSKLYSSLSDLVEPTAVSKPANYDDYELNNDNGKYILISDKTTEASADDAAAFARYDTYLAAKAEYDTALAAAETANKVKDADLAFKLEKNKDSVETPVMYFGDVVNKAEPVKFVFSRKYDIPLELDKTATKTGEEPDGTTTVNGVTVTKPATNPTLAGYKFDGWFIDKNGNFEYDSNDDKMVYLASGSGAQQITNAEVINPNITLTAKWVACQYTVMLDANNGKFGSTLGTLGSESYAIEARDTDGNTIKASVKSSATVEEAASGKTIDGTGEKNLFTVPTRDGYEFKGWATKADATVDEILTDETYKEIRPTVENGSVTLYAVYAPIKNFVKFKTFADSTLKSTGLESKTAGILAESNVEATVANTSNVTITDANVETGAALGTLPTAAKAGYTFDGWYKLVVNKGTTPTYSLVKVTSSSTVSYDDLSVEGADNDITLYAKFNINTYTITYDLDGGSWTDTQKKDVPETYTVKNIDTNKTNIVAPAKGSSGYYTFAGWQINNDTTKKYTDGNAIATYLKSNPGNVTIKALWDKNGVAGTGYYSFNLDGGTFYGVSKDEKFYTPGVSLDVSGSANADVAEVFGEDTITETSGTIYTPKKAGYTFTGWYSDEECTTKFDFANAKYPDETEVVVYAGWEADRVISYTMQYMLADEDGSLIPLDSTGKVLGTKTYIGSTDETVNAADKTIKFDGKTYVFDATLSKGKTQSVKLEASYKAFTNASETTGEDLVIVTPKGKAGEGDEKIYQIAGVFSEEDSQSEKTLGTATNVKADNGTVTFTAAANADHYKVQKTWTVNGVEKTATGAAFTGTTGTYNVPTGDYKIAIVAYNADGSKSTVSAAVEVKGAAVTLGKATNLNVKDGTVTFTAAAGADHYRVQKTYTVNGTTKTAKGSKFTTTTGTFGVPEGDYKIAIIAYADAAETQFTVSDAKEVKAATIDLEAVDTASITVNRGTGEVSWTASKGAKEYVVFKIVKENGKSKIYGGRRTSETTYKFANFPTDDFKVYIASIDANENKVYSATKKISTLPSATNVKVSDDYKTVSWTKATGDKADKIVKYQVAKFDSTTNKYSYGTKVDASQSSFTLGVKAKAGQQIFVIAFDADGNSSYSDAITVK